MLPINHLLKRLKLRLGDFEFLNHDGAPVGINDPRCWGVVLKSLNTGVVYWCNYRPSTKQWEVNSDTPADESFMTGLLNGHTRDEAGNLAPAKFSPHIEDGWQYFSNPEPDFFVDASCQWRHKGWQGQLRWEAVTVKPACFAKMFRDLDGYVEIRRRVDSPLMESNDKVAM